MPENRRLPDSGPLSLSMIQGEFGGDHPISLSEYYGVDAPVPPSGTISISDFYGTSSGIDWCTAGNPTSWSRNVIDSGQTNFLAGLVAQNKNHLLTQSIHGTGHPVSIMHIQPDNTALTYVTPHDIPAGAFIPDSRYDDGLTGWAFQGLTDHSTGWRAKQYRIDLSHPDIIIFDGADIDITPAISAYSWYGGFDEVGHSGDDFYFIYTFYTADNQGYSTAIILNASGGFVYGPSRYWVAPITAIYGEGGVSFFGISSDHIARVQIDSSGVQTDMDKRTLYSWDSPQLSMSPDRSRGLVSYSADVGTTYKFDYFDAHSAGMPNIGSVNTSAIVSNRFLMAGDCYRIIRADPNNYSTTMQYYGGSLSSLSAPAVIESFAGNVPLEAYIYSVIRLPEISNRWCIGYDRSWELFSA